MHAAVPSRSAVAWIRRWYQTAAWVLIVLSGIAVRLPGIGRPFWLDEAWVANSALAASLRQAFYYDTWLQTTPPLFVTAIRIAHQVFGGFEISFRAVPFSLNILAVLLALIFGERVFGSVPGLFLGAITATSPTLVSLSLQLKQYSADLFCAFLLMILIWNYSQSPTRKNFISLLTAFLVCMPLAYTSMIFLPLAGFILLHGNTGHKIKLLRTLTFGLLSLGMFLVLQFLFIRPNQSPELLAYWYMQGGFRAQSQNILKFYLHGFSTAIRMFYSRSSLLTRIIGSLAVCGIINLLVSIGNARSRVLLALACLPILTMLALNALRLYPFYAEKQDSFMFPCLAVLALCGATAIVEILPLGAKNKAILRPASIALCIVVTTTAVWMGIRNPIGVNSEDPASAVRFLERSARSGDLVYVHGSAEEQIKLYLKLYDVHGLAVTFGNTGWPCCTRNHQFETGPKSDSYVMLDFKSQTEKARPGRILMVFSDRAKHWAWLKRDEREIILRHAQDLGCQQVNTYAAGAIIVDDLHCDAPR